MTLQHRGYGLSTYRERKALHELGCKSPGNIVEVGTGAGRMTAFLAAQEKHRVWTLDPHFEGTAIEWGLPRRTIEEAVRVWCACGVMDWIIPMVGKSKDVADFIPSTIGLLFIDGDHTREGVTTDLELFAHRIMPGGIIAMHDFGKEAIPGRPTWGVKEAWDAWSPGKGFSPVEAVESLAFAYKL